MAKKTYYVSIQNGLAAKQPFDDTYDFEIVASEDQIEKLQQLFEETSNTTATVPAEVFTSLDPSGEVQERIKAHDRSLYAVYKMIYDLGTEKTKKYMEENDILNRIKESRIE